MSLTLTTEQQVAVAAVKRACSLTSSVFNKLVKNETLVKGDKSPVTVGDFAAQAVVNTILSLAFPMDAIVGEEDARDLRSPESAELRNRVLDLSRDALAGPLGIGEQEQWGLGPGKTWSDEELLGALDRGNGNGGRSGRFWCLDPIDGTKGFLRGEQYAVCLALVVDSQVQLGVIGCPNLPQDLSELDSPRGSLFVAVRGKGAQQMTITGGNPRPLVIPSFSPDQLNFLESVEAAHSSHSFTARVAELLEIKKEPTRMDSQAKYCALARGDGGVYLRMPTGVGYIEKIWDHAPGSLLIEEAGGVITDSRGQALDFGLGRTLGENFGVVAASKQAHGRVIDAIKKAREDQK